MTRQECKKIEFYLYNYNRINILIKEREMQIIDSINVSSRSWIKSLKGIPIALIIAGIMAICSATFAVAVAVYASAVMVEEECFKKDTCFFI